MADFSKMFHRCLYRIGLGVKKNAPKLLTAVSVFGVGWTAYESAKATPEAMEHIREAEIDKQIKTGDPDAKLTVLEKVKVAGPDYAKTAVVGTGTAVCMVTSTALSGKQVATATMAASMAQQAFAEHTTALREKLGPAQYDAVHDDIVTKKMIDNQPKNTTEIYDTGDGDDLFYYTRYGIWFWSSVDKVRSVQIDLNDDIDTYCGVSENELLEKFKLNHVVTGDIYGFPKYNSEGKKEPRVEFKLVYYRRPDGEVNPEYKLDYILNGKAAIGIDYYPYCGPCANWECGNRDI